MQPDEAFQLFGYSAPDEDQEKAMVQLRTKFGELAKLWVTTCPDGPEQTYVLRKLREASTAMMGSLMRPFPRHGR